MTSSTRGRDYSWLLRFAAALLLGSCGGLAFSLLNLPLAWMLGAMTACMIGAIAKVPIGAPIWIRPPMSAVIGAMLGAGFPSDILTRIPGWIIPLGGLVLFVMACALLCVSYFRWICGFDAKTAYFCGMPGGLIDMTLLGEEVGADSRRIALVQTMRILTVIFIVPVLVRMFNDPGVVVPASTKVSALDISPIFLLWLLGTCVAGIAVGSLLRLPARYLIGPMLVSACLHVSGTSDFVIPYELVVVAQIVLGVTIGCRFIGIAAGEVGRVLLYSAGSTAILLSLTCVFALLVGWFSGLDPVLLVLSYSPGGLAEMGLVALSLNYDTAIVAMHHIIRVMMVGLGAGIVFRLSEWFRRRTGQGSKLG